MLNTDKQDRLKSLISYNTAIGKIRENIQQTIVHMKFNDKTNILFEQAIKEIMLGQSRLEDAIEEAINFYSAR